MSSLIVGNLLSHTSYGKSNTSKALTNLSSAMGEDVAWAKAAAKKSASDAALAAKNSASSAKKRAVAAKKSAVGSALAAKNSAKKSAVDSAVAAKNSASAAKKRAVDSAVAAKNSAAAAKKRAVDSAAAAKKRAVDSAAAAKKRAVDSAAAAKKRVGDASANVKANTIKTLSPPKLFPISAPTSPTNKVFPSDSNSSPKTTQSIVSSVSPSNVSPSNVSPSKSSPSKFSPSKFSPKFSPPKLSPPTFADVKNKVIKFKDNQERKYAIQKSISDIFKSIGGKEDLDSFVKISKNLKSHKDKYLFPSGKKSQKFMELASLCNTVGTMLSKLDPLMSEMQEIHNPSCIETDTLFTLKESYVKIEELKTFLSKNFKSSEPEEVSSNLKSLANLFGDKAAEFKDPLVTDPKYEHWKKDKLPPRVLSTVLAALQDADVDVLKYAKKEYKIPDNVALTSEAIQTHLNQLTIFDHLVAHIVVPTDCTWHQRFLSVFDSD